MNINDNETNNKELKQDTTTTLTSVLTKDIIQEIFDRYNLKDTERRIVELRINNPMITYKELSEQIGYNQFYLIQLMNRPHVKDAYQELMTLQFIDIHSLMTLEAKSLSIKEAIRILTDSKSSDKSKVELIKLFNPQTQERISKNLNVNLQREIDPFDNKKNI